MPLQCPYLFIDPSLLFGDPCHHTGDLLLQLGALGRSRVQGSGGIALVLGGVGEWVRG